MRKNKVIGKRRINPRRQRNISLTNEKQYPAFFPGTILSRIKKGRKDEIVIATPSIS
jgi:hypothetical protein